jgi:hypothetical protein
VPLIHGLQPPAFTFLHPPLFHSTFITHHVRIVCTLPPQGLIICLFFNFIATTAALIGLGGDNIGSWLWSALYATGGIPGAFILWHMRLYNSAIKDSAFGYAIFFLFFVVAHMVFCVWSAVGECRCTCP